ncbi:oxidoreductase [Nocardioides bruguierae]|uniref:Oxidoreductase n=1 Tax=Nocardioides bruguierae TaxID=2945102 RepID=A0A9X2D7E4_9ACTN|nr:oxidoreductase [Nocardioides bruguierae]MCL8027471.1 oxidoreductase [Nocardioides bruguierae]MCM0620741.1 oxidoreductase [Nocardioides bruguierae]
MSADPLAPLLSLEGVPSAYVAARDAVDVVLRDRGLRRTSPETTSESLLRGAHASAVLAGSEATLAQVRSGEVEDRHVLAALRVSTALLSLAPLLRSTPLQALARIHALAGAGEVPEERLGRPRDEEAATRLRGLAQLLTATTRAPALVVAAVVHAELATLGPFGSHDGIVARAAERLVLVARGVDEKSLVVPEAGHLAMRAEYQQALLGYRDGGQAGVHAWLLHCARAYAAAAEASPLRRAAD